MSDRARALISLGVLLLAGITLVLELLGVLDRSPWIAFAVFAITMINLAESVCRYGWRRLLWPDGEPEQ